MTRVIRLHRLPGAGGRRHARRGARDRRGLRRRGSLRHGDGHHDAAHALRHRPVALRLRDRSTSRARTRSTTSSPTSARSTCSCWRRAATSPTGCPPSERAFIGEAARSGVLGPSFLTTRLRLRLSQSPALGGGCVVNTGAVRTWLELSMTPGGRSGRAGRPPPSAPATTGPGSASVSTASCTLREGCCPASTPRPPPRPRRGSRLAGDTLLRTQQQPLREAVADATLFLASAAGSRITGQTLRLS